MAAMAKKPRLPTPPAPPPPVRRRVPSTGIVLATIAVVAAGAVWYLRSATPPPDQTEIVATSGAASAATGTASAGPEETGQSTAPPVTAKFGPHKQENLPPVPFGTSIPARPVEAVRAAYLFAAEHPEVLSYVPCYCGCETSGHRGNDDCFVKSRADNGDVLEWDPHGVVCGVCIDVARDAMQMYASGASVRDIRAANERKWAGQFPTKTPTPLP